ncbi:MAG: RluA family pseudouridine synthase [Pirellulaceae bacterium]|nr:RluA family pseudouridine synthase [Pirellulaceae bacterium]
MPSLSPAILFEDNHLLVINKRPLLATMGTPGGEPSLVSLAKEYLKKKHNKPGNVYLGVVSRLDAHASGAIVLARTSKAAARLTKQFMEQTVKKEYWVVVSGNGIPQQGECVDWVLKNDHRHKMEVVSPQKTGAREARLFFQKLQSVNEKNTLLEVTLLTGRKHQIRVQMAHRRWPVVGDRKYGSPAPFGAGIALHCRRITIIHPTLKTEVTFTAPPPASWKSLNI